MTIADAPMFLAIECPGCDRPHSLLRVELTPGEKAWPGGYMAAQTLKARLREQQRRIHGDCWPTDETGQPLGLT